MTPSEGHPCAILFWNMHRKMSHFLTITTGHRRCILAEAVFPSPHSAQTQGPELGEQAISPLYQQDSLGLSCCSAKHKLPWVRSCSLALSPSKAGPTEGLTKAWGVMAGRCLPKERNSPHWACQDLFFYYYYFLRGMWNKLLHWPRSFGYSPDLP